MVKMIYFSYQINLKIGERPNNKNIEALNLTRNVQCTSFKALTWKESWIEIKRNEKNLNKK